MIEFTPLFLAVLIGFKQLGGIFTKMECSSFEVRAETSASQVKLTNADGFILQSQALSVFVFGCRLWYLLLDTMDESTRRSRRLLLSVQ